MITILQLTYKVILPIRPPQRSPKSLLVLYVSFNLRMHASSKYCSNICWWRGIMLQSSTAVGLRCWLPIWIIRQAANIKFNI